MLNHAKRRVVTLIASASEIQKKKKETEEKTCLKITELFQLLLPDVL